MNEVKIKILDQEYKLKQSFRALMLFEEMTGKDYCNAKDSISDVTKMFWCFLKGSNRDIFKWNYDEFIDVLDDNPEILEEFANYMKNLNPERGSNQTPPKKKRNK